MQTTEANLIFELKNGSVAAFTQIYELYFHRLYAYCLQFTGSKQEAEDIVQEVFVQLWCNRKKIIAEKSLRNLLYVIARNFLIKAFRQNINAPVFEDYVEYCNSIGKADASTIEYDEFKLAVEKYISELPDTQRKVVSLSRLENMSNKEIALRLGLNEQSVRNALSQGLKYIREKIKHMLTILILLFFS